MARHFNFSIWVGFLMVDRKLDSDLYGVCQYARCALGKLHPVSGGRSIARRWPPAGFSRSGALPRQS
jgi:hypothetical protein